MLQAMGNPEHRLLAALLYGTGLRITEALQLRVKDLDFDHRAIVVREGKGAKDRVVMLPESLLADLRGQLKRSRVLWEEDRADGGVACSCRMRWSASFRELVLRGLGSGSSRKPRTLRIRDPAWSGVTTSTTKRSRERSNKPSNESASRKRRRRTPCGIRSQRICCRADTTFGPSRTARPRRRQDNDDLHARLEARRLRRAQPFGSASSGLP